MILIVIVIFFIKVLDGVRTNAYLKGEDPEDKLTLQLDRFHILSRNKEEHFTYRISNPNITEIKNGILLPKEEGLTKITFYDKHNNKHKSLTVNILSKSTDAFDQMRQRWKDISLGDRYYDPTDSLMSNIQKNVDTKVIDLWNRMNKEEDRQNLWDITRKYATATAHMTSEFKSLSQLATAVMNKHSCHYLNKNLLIDTLSGLEWMRLNKYNAKVRTYGNWWDWEIGSPLHILNSLIMLFPILSDHEISKLLNEIDRYVPDPNYMNTSVYPKYKTKATGANLMDLSEIKIIQNALRREEKGINDAKKALMQIFSNVTKGDGFYVDGSFLQHKNVPSTGSYGFFLLRGMSETLSLIQSTKYAIVGKEIDCIFTWFRDAFAPLIYNGRFMDMVRERAISREFDDSIDSAKIFQAIMNIAELSTEVQAAVYKKMVKQWITNDFINGLTNYRDILLAKKFLDDSSIGTDGIIGTMFKNYAMMNRVVYRNVKKSFALGISMSSRRVQRYEVLNSENIHGWFIGDGMVYLYNGNLLQYSDHFWATVDPYRLPGITVEQVRRKDSSGTGVSSTDFVGGSILDDQTGMIAMDFINYGFSVSARKTWTVFDNAIIALGSGIKNTGKNIVETIFENRKFNKAINYKLYINDKEEDIISNPFKTGLIRVENITCIYLESRDPTQSIGYKLLTPQRLAIKVENRRGAWSEINKGESSKWITRKYLTIWKTHSEEIDDYNYVIYPSILREEFVQMKPITLLENSDYVHAVADSKGNLGVTIFVQGNYSIGNMIITQPMVLVKQDFANILKIAVADPTGYQVTPYIIKLKNNNYEISAIDKNVKAVLKNGVWLISIDPSNKLGQSSIISFTNKNLF